MKNAMIEIAKAIKNTTKLIITKWLKNILQFHTFLET